jgi:drug/metabolite transporter (DMT)-like permease
MSAVNAIRDAANGLPPFVRGATWMVLSCLLFQCMGAMLRDIAQVLPSSEVVFLRNVVSLMIMLPWMLRNHRDVLHANRPWLLCGRSAVMAVSMLTWGAAVARIPLADATAIGFTAPLFATACATFVLGERVGPRRWSAVGVGFFGMLLIIRPEVAGFSTGTGFAIFCAAATAWGTLLLKLLTRTEKPNTVVFYLYAIAVPLTGIPAVFVWQTPTLAQLGWIAIMGLLVTAGHLCHVRSFAETDASAVLPFDFSKLLFAALIGFAFFAEFPDIWVWIGAGIIFASSTYTARREAALSRAAGTADDEPARFKTTPPTV